MQLYIKIYLRNGKKTPPKQGKSNTAKLQLLSEYFLHSLFFIPSVPFLFSTPPNPILTENASDEALSLYYSLSLSRKR